MKVVKVRFSPSSISTIILNVFLLDDEEGRENLSNSSLETIVEKAQSPDPATQLQAVQVGPSYTWIL